MVPSGQGTGAGAGLQHVCKSFGPHSDFVQNIVFLFSTSSFPSGQGRLEQLAAFWQQVAWSAVVQVTPAQVFVTFPAASMSPSSKGQRRILQLASSSQQVLVSSVVQAEDAQYLLLAPPVIVKPSGQEAVAQAALPTQHVSMSLASQVSPSQYRLPALGARMWVEGHVRLAQLGFGLQQAWRSAATAQAVPAQ